MLKFDSTIVGRDETLGTSDANFLKEKRRALR